MKVIVLFDTDKRNNTYREYEAAKEVDEHLRKGGKVAVVVKHPMHGEYCMIDMISQEPDKAT